MVTDCLENNWFRGTTIGIDLKEIAPIPNVITIVGNIENKDDINKLIQLINGKADVVLSDLAPNVSGLWEMDQLKQIDLDKKCIRIYKNRIERKRLCFVQSFSRRKYF